MKSENITQHTASDEASAESLAQFLPIFYDFAFFALKKNLCSDNHHSHDVFLVQKKKLSYVFVRVAIKRLSFSLAQKKVVFFFDGHVRLQKDTHGKKGF